MTAVALHAVTSGRRDGPTVLLLGSLGSTVEMWEPQAAALGERFAVVRADHRGHGGSPVPAGPYALDDLVDDVVALLDRVGVARAHDVGLSLGGIVAMRLAAREPGRVDRLALLCTSSRFPSPQPWHDRAAAVRADGTASIADAVVERWFTADLRRRDPATVAHWRSVIEATPAEGYAACSTLLAGVDLGDDLPRITAPTLLIAGAEDPATPPDQLRTIAASLPGARLQVLEQAAHLANLEQAAVVNGALLAHLDPAGVGPAERGTAVRRAVLGDAHVDRATAATTPLTAPFQDLVTRYAWGDVWSRPGLDRRTRSLLTLALLTALGHEHELAMHVRAAITNGVTPQEVSEVLLHSAVYAGVPAANRAFAVAQRILEQEGQPVVP